MKSDSLHDLRTVALFSILALALLAFAAMLSVAAPQPIPLTPEGQSPEVSVKEYSPLGYAGGTVVPASCNSYAHTPGECTPPTFTCTPSSVNEGESTTCSWTCPSAYNTSSAGTNLSTGGALSGSANVSPESDTSYTVTCSPTSSFTTVSVIVLNPSLSISANPTRVRPGESSNITWSASSVNEGSCSVKRSNGSTFATGESGGPQTTGALNEQETYTLTCATDAGASSVSVTVTLVPGLIEI